MDTYLRISVHTADKAYATKILGAEKHQNGDWGLVCEDPDITCLPAVQANGCYICENDLGYVVIEPPFEPRWVSSSMFEMVFVRSGQLSFGHALMALKVGERMRRSGWNGNGMFVFLVNGSEFKVNREPLLSILGEGTEVTYHPHIDLSHPDGSISVWQPSMGDVMADDWEVVKI